MLSPATVPSRWEPASPISEPCPALPLGTTSTTDAGSSASGGPVHSTTLPSLYVWIALQEYLPGSSGACAWTKNCWNSRGPISPPDQVTAVTTPPSSSKACSHPGTGCTPERVNPSGTSTLTSVVGTSVSVGTETVSVS